MVIKYYQMVEFEKESDENSFEKPNCFNWNQFR